MALWNTFFWSDGTLWADANGPSEGRTSFIDRSAYHISLKLTHTNTAPPGSLTSFVIQSISVELGVRPQLPSDFEAFIDRNDNTQRIALKIHHESGGQPETLDTESEDVLFTEASEEILLDVPEPLVIDQIHMLVNQRSRQQPTA